MSSTRPGLFDGLLGQLGTAGAGPMPDLSDMLGDTRAVIYLPTRRRCRCAVLIDLSMQVEGERADMHLDYAITNVNEPVEFPTPAPWRSPASLCLARVPDAGTSPCG